MKSGDVGTSSFQTIEASAAELKRRERIKEGVW